MARLRTDATAAPPIPDDAAAILLRGWGAEPPGGRQQRGFGGIGFLFLPDVDLGDVWREYEAYLRALAERWRWEPQHWIAAKNEYGLRFVLTLDDAGADQHERPFTGPHFYAEALQIAGPQQR